MSLKSNKKFIIFDLDGTLINSVPDLRNAMNAVLSQKNYRKLSIEEVSAMIGNGVEKLIERALAKVKNDEVSQEEIQYFMSNYREHYKNHVCIDTYLYPNVKETLGALYEKQYAMVICTNKPFEYVEPILEKLEIKNYFEHWIGEDSLASKKPSAEPLEFLMNKFGYNQDETVMVGDSKNDILAAQNAGIDSVGVSYGYNYDESIADYNPTKVVTNFAEIKDLLA